MTSSSYDIHRIPLGGGSSGAVGNVPFLYDMAFDGALLVGSVGEATFSTTTLEMLDPSHFARTVFATLQGASGPVAITAGSDLLYGTNDFGAMTQSVLSFDPLSVSLALMGGPPLTEMDATVVASGFVGTTAMQVDSSGQIYVVDNDFFGGTSRIAQIDGMGGVATLVDAPAGFFFARLAYDDTGGSLAPFTGPDADRLGVLLSDFATANVLATIEPSEAGGILWGDCNLDSAVDVTDALFAAQADIGLLNPTSSERAHCDVNGDADLDIIDALLVALSSAGFPVTLGY